MSRPEQPLRILAHTSAVPHPARADPPRAARPRGRRGSRPALRVRRGRGRHRRRGQRHVRAHRRAAEPGRDRRPARGLDLDVYSWGDYDAPEVLEAFTKDKGPTITTDSFGSNEELISKLVARQGDRRLRHRRADRRVHPADGAERAPRADQQGARAQPAAHGPAVPRPGMGPRQQLLDLQGVGDHRVRLRPHEDHPRAEDLDRLRRLRDQGGERQGLAARRPGRDHRDLLLGQRDRLEHHRLRPDRRRREVRRRHPRPARRGLRLLPRCQAIPQGTQWLMQCWNGDARIGIQNSKDPDKWQWVLGSPTTELWMDNWAIAAAPRTPRRRTRSSTTC